MKIHMNPNAAQNKEEIKNINFCKIFAVYAKIQNVCYIKLIEIAKIRSLVWQNNRKFSLHRELGYQTYNTLISVIFVWGNILWTNCSCQTPSYHHHHQIAPTPYNISKIAPAKWVGGSCIACCKSTDVFSF